MGVGNPGKLKKKKKENKETKMQNRVNHLFKQYVYCHDFYSDGIKAGITKLIPGGPVSCRV